MISFKEWNKVEIKTGKVKEVEDHPNADKLYVLKVDTGEERTIVTGLKGSYSKEDLKDKTVVVLCNLEEKELRGVKSEGMVLAAVDGNEISLLVPDKEMREGSKIE